MQKNFRKSGLIFIILFAFILIPSQAVAARATCGQAIKCALACCEDNCDLKRCEKDQDCQECGCLKPSLKTNCCSS